MILHFGLRAFVYGALVSISAISLARAEGTYEIPAGVHFNPDKLVKEIPYYALRHTIKPGITGWAQVCYPYGASLEETVEKLQYDLYYVKHRSAFLDLVIALKTVGVLLHASGR